MATSRSTAGAMRRAAALYRPGVGRYSASSQYNRVTPQQYAYTSGANRSLRSGASPMSAHKAGLQEAGLS